MDRYSRQTILDQIGKTGQQRLGDAHVVIIGCGGLGSIAAPYLAGAGVGQLSLIDGDMINISNLHRQVFFSADDDRSKSDTLADHILRLNPEIKVNALSKMANKSNIETLIKNATLVLECTDDMMTKYLVNDACAMLGIPMIYGAIYKYDGYVSVFANQQPSDCHLRDIFPEPQLDIPSCSDVGVFNTLAGMIGLMQANEALKMILKLNNSLINKLLTYNILSYDQMILELTKNFKDDMQDLFTKTSYATISCDVADEISLNIILQNRDEYDLISILEEHEHSAILPDIRHIPLSKLIVSDFKNKDSKTVFYCQTGKRSGALVARIKSQRIDAQVFSLAGGLNKGE